MTQTQKLSSFIFTTAVAIGLFIYLALPYPYTPFGQWLESQIRSVDYCTCFWPWWLFVIASIAITLISRSLYRYLVLNKSWLWVINSSLSITIIIYHNLARNYYLSQSHCEDSVYSPWVWLFILIPVFLLTLTANHPKQHRTKQ